MIRVLLLGVVGVSFGQIIREIERGPEGNLIINLGGLPEQRFVYQQDNVFRARARGVVNEDNRKVHGLENMKHSLPQSEDYDYDLFGQITEVNSKDGNKQNKKAKSNRNGVIELLSPKEDQTQTERPVAKPYIDVDIPNYGVNHEAALGPRDSILNEFVTATVRHGGCSFKDEPTKNETAIDVPRGTRTPRQNIINNVVSPAALSATYERNGQLVEPSGNAGLPLPECYRTQQGMLCCNRILEELIYQASDLMVNRNQNKCNIDIYSEILKNMAEQEFQTTFEVIAANGDFAAKANFKDNLLCKSLVNSKFVLIYATPESYPINQKNVKLPLTQ
ncbi:unnamed protein product [Bursaphelenchus xylophilus]|uniref:(pine wood nematode) hypothetical protein n=1 Tax=Bursaphelenchus xylophilus TaxID=6326 RepID=A0A1I7S9W8_BURXY|nr:unnamed protein product [Bursaphelenchus xylophilus]CAG9126236.1 unnamed protein product [Bursaphelenchus xylophilus]